MVEFNTMKFSASIAVLYKIRSTKGHQTLQETYNFLMKADIDTMMDVLRVAHNLAEDKNLSFDEFLLTVAEQGIGFICITQLFSELVEQLMYSGLSPEEVAAKKELMRKSKPN